MVFQLEGCHRYDAIQEIAVLCRYTRDHDIKATAENLLKKLRELSEDDCRELICDILLNTNNKRLVIIWNQSIMCHKLHSFRFCLRKQNPVKTSAMMK